MVCMFVSEFWLLCQLWPTPEPNLLFDHQWQCFRTRLSSFRWEKKIKKMLPITFQQLTDLSNSLGMKKYWKCMERYFNFLSWTTLLRHLTGYLSWVHAKANEVCWFGLDAFRLNLAVLVASAAAACASSVNFGLHAFVIIIIIFFFTNRLSPKQSCIVNIGPRHWFERSSLK